MFSKKKVTSISHTGSCVAFMKTSQNSKKDKQDKDFIEEVFQYYKREGRHTLPWRKKITPYRILVSEVMLQQTQVRRVVPKFELWMKEYPTLQSLSASNLQKVLVLWQGLGYQRRAKALCAIAGKVTILPKTFDELLRLPGVGTYTASAVCAFAYNTFSHPVLETNIRTALIEYFHQDIDSVHDGLLYDDLSRLEKNPHVQEIGARAWYYALMDFGAYLKANNISHNTKSVHNVKQTPYKGSSRELRAKVLFAIAHNTSLPTDERVMSVLKDLEQEGFIVKKQSSYTIAS